MGRRGPAPKPQALNQLAGNPGKRDRKNGDFEPYSEIPRPATHLGKYAKKEWKRIVPHLHNSRVLTQADEKLLEAYCQAYDRFVVATRELRAKGYTTIGSKGNEVKSPWVDIQTTAEKNMLAFAKEFGITPSARSNVSIDEADEETNPILSLIRKKDELING